MKLNNLLCAVVLMITVVFAQACFDSGGAGAGHTPSHLIPGDKAFAGGAVGAAKALRAGAIPIGTVVGYLPVNAPLHKSHLFTIKSALGYLYTVPNHNRDDEGKGTVPIEGLGDNGGVVSLYFEKGDCTGQAYVQSTDLTDYGASQGVVFRQQDGALNEVTDNPAQYYYVPSRTARTEPVAYQSRFENISQCVPETGNLSWGYAALPNDPAVTGVESGPLPIPITIDEPAP